jgi:hypothetical protein
VAQVGSADVNAPVRVLSDGDNGAASGTGAGGSSGGGPQTATDSTGTAQLEPAIVNAPIRVISDGDDPAAQPSQTDSPGRDPSGSGDPTPGGTDPPGDGGGTSGPGGENPGSVGGVPGAEDLGGDAEKPGEGTGGGSPGSGGHDLVLRGDTQTGTRPVTDVLSGGDGGTDSEDVPAGSVRVLGAQAGSLPVTGLGLLGTFVLGLVLMTSGAALRRGGVEPS